jgi:cbb3-type cytochrome oxidase maturation protein
LTGIAGVESLYLLIGVSMLFVGASVAVLLWAINVGQFDDLDGDGARGVAEDETPPSRPSQP